MTLQPLLASSPDPVALILLIPGPWVVSIVACLALLWNATGGRRTDGGVLASVIAIGLAVIYLVMLMTYGTYRIDALLYAAGVFAIVVGIGSVLAWRRRR